MRDKSVMSRTPSGPARLGSDRNILVCAALLFVYVIFCASQARGQEAPAQKVLHNEDVVSLAKAGLSDAAIISVIRTSQTGFDLSPEGLVSLRRAGVSNAVIEAMLGTPTSGPPTTAPAQALLPVAFGYYVVEGNETRGLISIKPVTRVGLKMSTGGGFAVDGLEGEPSLTIRTTTPVFIVYQQSADVSALLLSDLVYVSTMKAFEFNISGTRPFLFPSLYGRNYDDTVQVNVWRPKTDVPLRVEPVEGKAGMYRLIPSSPLKPGRYTLYAREALHHEDIILGTGAIRPSAAFYFGVSTTASISAAEPPPTQPVNPAPTAPQPLPPVASSCSSYDACIQSGTTALKSLHWGQALADFQKASNLEPSRPEAWDGAGTALLRLGRYQEVGAMWDKALQLGGTLRAPGCHRHGLRCDLGVLQLSLSALSFVNSNGQTLFAATPREVISQAVPGVLSGIYSVLLNIGSKKYKIFYFPEGAGCSEKLFDERCKGPGKMQQQVFAEYVDRTILRIATGESTKKE